MKISLFSKFVALALTTIIALAVSAHTSFSKPQNDEVLVAKTAGLIFAEIDAKLLRFPDVSQTHVVFSYASDLWLVAKEGGQATRLTTHEGDETSPKFSPDGQYVAFTAPYTNGNEDIYILPITGGIPKRITHHPSLERVLDWHPDGSTILFSSDMQSERGRYNQLYTVSVSGGMPDRLPMPYGEMASFSHDGNSIAYSYLKDFQNRPNFNYESWKRYRGGRAPDIWSYNLSTKTSARMTSHKAPDSAPMWTQSGLYYLSERDGQRSNIWRFDVENDTHKRITDFKEDDVTRPSMGPLDIVFELGGDLHLLDKITGKAARIDITLNADQFDRAPYLRNVSDRITHAEISKDNKTLVLAARGDILTMDIETGISKSHTVGSAYAQRFPSLSNDGKFIAFISDETGEYQLTVKNLTTGTKRLLTQTKTGLYYNPYWSPDGKKIAILDSTQNIHIIDVGSKKDTVIDKGIWFDFYSSSDFPFSWSKDSQWLAYSIGLKNRNRVIKTYNVKTKIVNSLTSGYYNDHSPVFGVNGNYLYMISERSLNPTQGDIDTTWTYANSNVITVAPLRTGVANPVDKRLKMKPPTEKKKINIDSDGFENRISVLPVEPGSYAKLLPTPNGVVYVRRARAGSHNGQPTLASFNIDQLSETVIAKGRLQLVDSSVNKVLVQKQNEYFLLGLTKNQTLTNPLLTSDIRVVYDRKLEARQIIMDAWRFQRDFFYDPGLHGVNWDAERDKYLALSKYAVTDTDLSFLLREMVGEISAGHVWAVSVPRKRYSYADTGYLGADFELKKKTFWIKKIFNTGVRHAEHKSPLALTGMSIKEGDYILAINGKPLDPKKGFYAALEGLADENIELTYNQKPTLKNAKTVIVKPMRSERKLRELAWVEKNRERVEKLSDGKLGYIYVPDTSRNGQDELVRQYRAQFDKQGLVIDERFNSGGALGDRLVELLNRPPLVYFSSRNGQDYPLPEFSHYGPKALIINGWSYSGGDGFPLLFKAAGVGPLIGEATWGGLIGPSASVPFVSGGRMATPPQRVYNLNGEWAEPNGVQPDIKVENDPGLMMEGRDPQLEAAVKNVMERLHEYPKHMKPAYPSQVTK